MDYEISLKDTLKTIWDGRRILLTITAAAVLISAIISFFVLKPIYEVMATARIGDEEKLPMLKSFVETLKSDSTLNQILVSLQLDPDRYSIGSLRENISLQVANGTQVMVINVKGSNPQDITKIANLLVFQLAKRFEISDRSIEIVKLRMKVTELEQAISAARKTLEETNNQLNQVPEKFITKQSLSNQPFLHNVLGGSALKPEELETLRLETEQVNPVYQSLLQIKTQTAIELKKLETELAFHQELIKMNEEIISRLESADETEALNESSSRRMLSEFSAVFIQAAIEPVTPVGPNKLLIILGSAATGIVVALAIIFIRKLWKDDEVVLDGSKLSL